MKSIAQLKDFLKVGEGMRFVGNSQKEKYRWIDKTLFRFRYVSLRKKEKSIVKTYMMHMTGYSDAQIGRLIQKKRDTRTIKPLQRNKNKFPRVYDTQDVAMLIKTDKAHGRLSGRATKEILRRAHEVFDQEAYERVKNISVSHIYNLRGTRQYRSVLGTHEKTNPVSSHIGERKKPNNEGKPGYIRVDTVHQGDKVVDGKTEKGVYHVNLVDEVLQWEIIVAVEKITERFLVPVLEAAIEQFPFIILNFHSDNGSEYINHTVANLLNKLNIYQTKSRARHSNDNGLVETKNGAIIRKHMGHAYIEQKQAEKINIFYKTYLNPYLNFHRPCGFPEDIPDPKKKGKIKKQYNTYLTPFERLKTLSMASKFLKKGVTMELLETFALQLTDTQAAEQMQKAKYQLFSSIREDRKKQIYS